MIAPFAVAPALPLHTAGPYVAAAYIVFLVVVLSYVWIMARKLTRNSRELRELRAEMDERAAAETGSNVPSHTPFPNETDNDSDSHYQFELTEKAASPADGGADE